MQTFYKVENIFFRKHSIFFSVSHETDAWFMNFLYNLLFSKNLKKYFYTVDFENEYLKIKFVVVSKQYSIIHIYARILMLSTTSAACFACVRSLDIGFHFSVILITIVMFLRLCFLDTARADAAATGSLCKVLNVKLRKARLANWKSWF